MWFSSFHIRLVRIAVAVLFFYVLFEGRADAQHLSLSTNVVEWVNLGTVNVEAGYGFSQHLSVHAGLRYNNWTFQKGNPEARFDDLEGENEKQFENRKQAYALKLRYWPWHIYSEFWFYGGAQWMEYNRGGLFGKHTAEEGTSAGLCLGVGYTRMLSRKFNVEFGVGVWAGSKDYVKYRCTNCGSITDKGKGMFAALDDVFISIVYVF